MIITLRGEKQEYLSARPAQDRRGLKPGRMHDWRGNQALHHTIRQVYLAQKQR